MTRAPIETLGRDWATIPEGSAGSAKAPAVHATTGHTAARPPEHDEESTRERVLNLVISDGPISAAALAKFLGLTAAGVRRHLTYLEEAEQIEVFSDARPAGARGRPSRKYVGSVNAQGPEVGAYSEVATEVLSFLNKMVGSEAVEAYAAERLGESAKRYAPFITATDTATRVAQLAEQLTKDGFAASVRPVDGIPMLQLCQGQCPVQHVAAQFPQLCEAESKVFSELLGVHTQRLVTLAGGGHVCTTNVPVHNLEGHQDRPSFRNVEGK